MSSTVDVTVVLNAHNEGILLHRSLRSAEGAVEYAAAAGFSAEIILILDAPTAETRAYVDAHHIRHRVEFVDYRDVSRARNHGVKIAHGEHIAFLDGDDLFGENWLSAALKDAKVRDLPLAVRHPACSVYFGATLHTWWHCESTAHAFRPQDLLESNFWTALAFGRRQLFLEQPYRAIDLANGFGLEDWQFNCEILGKGGAHLVVPETMHFVRVKRGSSLLARSNQLNALIAASALFTSDTWLSAALHDDGHAFLQLPNAGAWTEELWRSAAKIEPEIKAAPAIAGLDSNQVKKSRCAKPFARILRRIFGARRVLITPSDDLDTSAGRAARVTAQDNHAYLISLADCTLAGLDREELIFVLARVLVETRPTHLDIIGNELLCEFLRRHGRSVCAHTKVTMYLRHQQNCEALLNEIIHATERIVVKDEEDARRLQESFAVPANILYVEPLRDEPRLLRQTTTTRSQLRCVWNAPMSEAAHMRVADLVDECTRLPIQFYIFGIPADSVHWKKFHHKPNIHLCGGALSFNALPAAGLDALLYSADADRDGTVQAAETLALAAVQLDDGVATAKAALVRVAETLGIAI